MSFIVGVSGHHLQEREEEISRVQSKMAAAEAERKERQRAQEAREEETRQREAREERRRQEAQVRPRPFLALTPNKQGTIVFIVGFMCATTKANSQIPRTQLTSLGLGFFLKATMNNEVVVVQAGRCVHYLRCCHSTSWQKGFCS